MRALILAAGIGYRLGGGERQPPKSLLRFEGRSLLARHLDALAACGVAEVSIGVGYRADAIAAEVGRTARAIRTILASSGMKLNKRVVFEIIE